MGEGERGGEREREGGERGERRRARRKEENEISMGAFVVNIVVDIATLSSKSHYTGVELLTL